jgi:hypothetical protein
LDFRLFSSAVYRFLNDAETAARCFAAFSGSFRDSLALAAAHTLQAEASFKRPSDLGLKKSEVAGKTFMQPVHAL